MKKGKTLLSAVAKPTGCIIAMTPNQIKIVVSAKPGAKVSSISGMDDESVMIQIAAPPVDGKANKELIDFLSEVLDAKKADLSIGKGGKSKNKVVLYNTDENIDYVYQKIRGAMKNENDGS